MPLGQMGELYKLGEDHQDPRENPSLLEAQYFWDEEDEEEEVEEEEEEEGKERGRKNRKRNY